MLIVPKNWRDFQHYKDRNPPWIRLHRGLLDNYEFQCLPLASRALAPMLWLLASESVNGAIDAAPAKLAFRLRCTIDYIEEALKPLIDAGFFMEWDGASNVLAACEHIAVPETEAETEAIQKSPSETKRPKPEVSVSELVEAGMDELLAQDFITHKRQMKAPLTQRAWKDHQREAQKAGWSVSEAAEKVLAKSWKGFEAKYVENERPKRQQSPPESFRAQDSRAAAERVRQMTGGLVSARPEAIDVPTRILDRPDLLEDDGDLRIGVDPHVGRRGH